MRTMLESEQVGSAVTAATLLTFVVGGYVILQGKMLPRPTVSKGLGQIRDRGHPLASSVLRPRSFRKYILLHCSLFVR